MKRKYCLQEDFFSKWNKDSAYVYGFWLADGHMRISKSYRIYFSSADMQILNDINKAMTSTAVIRKDRRTSSYSLVLHSKNIYLDILSHGGHTAKSCTITYPKIPINLIPDFIRGYFDGDGSVHIVSYKASKNNKLYSEIRSNFTSGSKKFLIKIRSILEAEINLKHRVIGQYGLHQYKLGYGQQDTLKLMNYIYYPNHTLSLSRKAKYLSYIKSPSTSPG